MYISLETMQHHKPSVDQETSHTALTLGIPKVRSTFFLTDSHREDHRTAGSLVGYFKDPQVPNSYAKYADRFMETLLVTTIDVMKKKTGLDLIPTYSYTRLYRKGNILRRHKDRPSCEISTTLNLGGDPWPIYIDPTGENNVIDEYKSIVKPGAHIGVEVNLKPGDMLIYSGCELEHWRKPFEGNLCGQVFLHYNHANGRFAKTNLYDKRPLLGIPKTR